MPRPDGLSEFCDPQVRCAAHGCGQPAGTNFGIDEEMCCVHAPLVGQMAKWLAARSMAGPERSFRCAQATRAQELGVRQVVPDRSPDGNW